MKTKNLLFASVMATAALFASCDDCEDNGCNKGETCDCGDDCDCKDCNCYYGGEMISDLGGGGDFLVINMNENDTIILSGIVPSLTVQNGAVVKIKFAKADKYRDYDFSTTYTFADGSVIKDEAEYEFVVTDNLAGNVVLEAVSFSRESKCHSGKGTITVNGVVLENVSAYITASARFRLNLKE